MDAERRQVLGTMIINAVLATAWAFLVGYRLYWLGRQQLSSPADPSVPRARPAT
jgi:hypothetical protein